MLRSQLGRPVGLLADLRDSCYSPIAPYDGVANETLGTSWTNYVGEVDPETNNKSVNDNGFLKKPRLLQKLPVKLFIIIRV